MLEWLTTHEPDTGSYRRAALRRETCTQAQGGDQWAVELPRSRVQGHRLKDARACRGIIHTMTPDTELAAYLDRIELAAPPAATAAGLADLHLAHAMHIPFENLDVLLGRPIRLISKACTRNSSSIGAAVTASNRTSSFRMYWRNSAFGSRGWPRESDSAPPGFCRERTCC